MKDKLRTSLTKKELADELRVSTTTINKWMKNRNMPYFKFIGQCRFDLEEVYEWIEKNSKN